MIKKKCKDCGKLKNKLMFYGVQGECRECSKKRIKENYYLNRKHYIAYEKERNQNPLRKANRILYQRTQRLKNKGKNLARYKLNKAVKKGLIIKQPCEKCNDIKSEAHHPDYRKPLSIIWLCRIHHMEIEGKKPF